MSDDGWAIPALRLYIDAQAYASAAKVEEICRLLFALKARQRALQGVDGVLSAIYEDFHKATRRAYSSFLEPECYRVAPDIDRILVEAFRPIAVASVKTIWGIPVEADPALPLGAWYLRAVPRGNEPNPGAGGMTPTAH